MASNNVKGGTMKYVFAVGRMAKQSRFGHLLDVYQLLSEKFGEVAIYHRDCRKTPLFSGAVTVISDCPSCRSHFSTLPSVTLMSLNDALA